MHGIGLASCINSAPCSIVYCAMEGEFTLHFVYTLTYTRTYVHAATLCPLKLPLACN